MDWKEKRRFWMLKICKVCSKLNLILSSSSIVIAVLYLVSENWPQQQFCYSRISGSDYYGQTLVILVLTLLCVSWSPRSSVRTHNRTEVKLRLCFYTIYKKLFLQVFFLPASRSQVVKFYIQQVSSCCCWLQKLSERWKRNYFLFTILSNTPQETKIHIFKTDLIFF